MIEMDSYTASDCYTLMRAFEKKDMISYFHNWGYMSSMTTIGEALEYKHMSIFGRKFLDYENKLAKTLLIFLTLSYHYNFYL